MGRGALQIRAMTDAAANRQNGPPDAAQVRAQVERMTKSHVFANSPQLSAFLLFIVEAALRGQGERLKGYTIGVEVLRRDVTFDPQIDPIVRVEATRLRRATACTIYAVRPEVCRACQPGDDSCTLARRHYGLAAIELAAVDAL